MLDVFLGPGFWLDVAADQVALRIKQLRLVIREAQALLKLLLVCQGGVAEPVLVGGQQARYNLSSLMLVL